MVGRKEKGVRTVRVEKKKIADHCSVIDGYRRLVVDSYSSLPLKPSKAVLNGWEARKCVNLRLQISDSFSMREGRNARYLRQKSSV